MQKPQIAMYPCKGRDRVRLERDRVMHRSRQVGQSRLPERDTQPMLGLVRIRGSTELRWVQTPKVTMQLACTATVSTSLGSLHDGMCEFLHGLLHAPHLSTFSSHLILLTSYKSNLLLGY
ncbi:hypothetical protein Taro_027078 [Colocasia esculenta]|uniref:Uncharacterized protein n=1 Tax=Colocasia esculenta TaxID=4460 RepID=A0A843VML1_COLES|nr:hypothetical protein [Colocasia esculenta]